MTPPASSQSIATARDIAALEVRMQNIERRSDNIETEMRVLPAIEKELGIVCETIDTHKRALYGVDGRPGIVGRLSAVEEKMDDLKRLMMAVGVAVAIQVVIALFRLL